MVHHGSVKAYKTQLKLTPEWQRNKGKIGGEGGRNMNMTDVYSQE